MSDCKSSKENDNSYVCIEDILADTYNGMDDKETIEHLKTEVIRLRDGNSNYYATNLVCNKSFTGGYGHIPVHGVSAAQAKEQLVQIHELDNRPRLNTSSYVNVVFEKEEEDVAIQGLSINIADGSVYPASVELHDNVVDAIAKLWNCPEHVSPEGEKLEHFAGAGTVGSTEACLLALLAHKMRWRDWYKERHGLSDEEVIGVIPNIVIPTHYQACWEKAFRYFDIKPKFMYPEFKKFKIHPEDMRDLVDEKTMMVVGVLGNHYNGTYDPIWEMDKILSEINEEKDFQVGLHVDSASGGFIAPFQDDVPAWDFRLKNVLSISASGHKFGESCCGTGWVVFRHRHNLSEHIEVEVTYLGGLSYSMTLNFSRPATGIYVQAYKFLRMGMLGYRTKVQNQLKATMYFRNLLRDIKWTDGNPFFQICDPDDEPGLPVFSARVNPELDIEHDDFDIQHAVAEFHWYVSAYRLSFEDFSKGGVTGPLCKDEPEFASMFRVVFKSNLTHSMADDLFKRLNDVIEHFKEESKCSLGSSVIAPPRVSDIAPLPVSERPKLGGGRNAKAMSLREFTMSRHSSISGLKPFSNQHAAC
jgi:glutamate decarboxylase